MNHTLFAEAVTGTDAINRSQELLQSVYRWLAENGLKFGVALVTALVIYLIGAWVANMTRAFIKRMLVKRGMDETFASYLGNIVHAIIMVLVLITVLGQLGVPTAQFAALIAAAGLAIGLALQGNLSNFASGFLLVFFRPFKRGDYIAAGGSEGVVDEVGVFTSTLTTADNRKVIIPNSAITGGNITNFSVNPKRALAVACVVAGENPVEKVRATLLSAAKGNTKILSDPAPVAVMTHLGEGKYTIELRAWCQTAHYWEAVFTLNEAIKAALEQDRIISPMPAMKIIQ